MQEAATNLFRPNEILIRQHLEFVTSGMADFCDGRIEIAYGDKDNIPRHAETFSTDEIEKAVQFAAKKNAEGRNIYLVGAYLDPEAAPFGRSSDTDFYSSGVIWCDIDRQVDINDLRQAYSHLPPALVVVTGRTPHVRMHLWWKLSEPVTDADTLREALEGVQERLGGDRAVKNVTSLMRLGGTVAWPKKAGRVTEQTEVILPANASQPVSIETFLREYPAGAFQHAAEIVAAQDIHSVAVNPFEERIEDGREKYMHEMLCATILNLTAELGRWPTGQEVFDDAWPVYSRKVTARLGKTLDQEGRGQKLMQSKIKSKLSAFMRGKVRGFETIEQVATNNRNKARAEPLRHEPAEHTTDTGEVLDEPENRKILPFKWAYDIEPQINANDFVEGMLGCGQFSVVYGESNCGKTFFMTDLAFHVAMGKRWRGRRVDQGGVVYVALEGSYGLSNRIAAFMETYPDDSRGMPFAVVTTQINFLDNAPDGQLAAFIETVKYVAEKVGNVKLVVVDTLARAISGGDENSGQDMGLLVSHADTIRQATGAHVCFIHHSGKDKAKGARGHSSLRAAVDTEVEVSRGEDENFSTVKTVKQRDMEMAEDMFFSLKSVTIGVNKHNEEVTSCVVETIEPEEATKPRRGAGDLTHIQQFIYDAICNALVDHGQMRNIGGGVQKPCISYQQLGEQLEHMGFRDEVPEGRAKNTTLNARTALRKKNRIGFNQGWIWLIDNE